jgi:hypothetical protein
MERSALYLNLWLTPQCDVRSAHEQTVQPGSSGLWWLQKRDCVLSGGPHEPQAEPRVAVAKGPMREYAF